MNLRKAIIMAQKTGRGIARRSQFPRPIWLIPTNTTERIIIVADNKFTPRWEPSYEDLIAKDWVVHG